MGLHGKLGARLRRHFLVNIASPISKCPRAIGRFEHGDEVAIATLLRTRCFAIRRRGGGLAFVKVAFDEVSAFRGQGGNG